MPKQIFISVINDLVTDNRVNKVALSLIKMGFKVTLIGRRLPNSQTISDRPYRTKRMRLLFKKGPFFYLEFNIRLLLVLLFSRADIFLSNDLDTLLANHLVSKIRNKPLVYDSHEYFTEVPELINRPAIQKIWLRLERAILPQIKHAYTVCESIAEVYHQNYGTPFQVVRNLPLRNENSEIPTNYKLVFPEKKIILYQGALNLGRGLECAIQSMQYIENTQLLLAGDGDLADDLKNLSTELNLTDKVTFLGRIPLEEMKWITAQADAGLSIEEDLGLNYRFALPNKLFDYIQQGVPVLVSNLPEMKRIVDRYRVGLILEKHDPKLMAKQFEQLLFNNKLRNSWKANLIIAAKELCWENEEKVLQKIYSHFINQE